MTRTLNPKLELVRSSDVLDRVELLCGLLRCIDSASHALEWWVEEGGPPKIQILSSRERPLLPSEFTILRAGHRIPGIDRVITTGIDRVGMLYSPQSNRVLASTRALVLPSRLPHAVRAETGLDTEAETDPDDKQEQPLWVPLGASLLAHDVVVRRDAALAKPVTESKHGHQVVAMSRALLVVDDLPAAIATERYTKTLIDEFEPPADLVDAVAELTESTVPAHPDFPADSFWTGSDHAGVLMG